MVSSSVAVRLAGRPEVTTWKHSRETMCLGIIISDDRDGWCLYFGPVLQGEVHVLQLCLGRLRLGTDAALREPALRRDWRRARRGRCHNGNPPACCGHDLLRRRDAEFALRPAVSPNLRP